MEFTIKDESQRLLVEVSKKRKFKKEFKVQRWLEDGSIVRFSIKNRYKENCETIINENENHIIWFSQLADVFVNLKELNFITGELILKNGEELCLNDISSDQFISLVEGRKFKVKVFSDGGVARINEDAPYLYYEENLNYIKQLVNESEINVAARFLEPAILYDLIEV